MKIREVEAVATPAQVRDRHGVVIFNEPTAVYTAKEMQEYAKAKIKELLFEQLWNDRFYANSKIFFDKEVEKICNNIFAEDTKND